MNLLNIQNNGIIKMEDIIKLENKEINKDQLCVCSDIKEK